MATPLMTTETTIVPQSHVIHKEYEAWRNELPANWRNYLNEYTPPKRGRFITFMPIIGLGSFAQKPEGEAPMFDAPSTGPLVTANFSTYALGVMISQEAKVEDPIDLIAKAPKMLAKSARDTQDKILVKTYVFAFSGGQLMSDGQPLISNAHVMDPQISPTGVYSGSGTFYSNSLGNAQLTPEALMRGDMLMETLVDDRGLKDKRTLRRLIIPTNPKLAQIAQEIVGTDTHPYSIARKENPQHNRWRVDVNRDLINQSAWFLQAENGEPGDDCHGLTAWFRWQDGDKKNGFRTFIDPMSGNTVIISSFRLATIAWCWQGIVGSLGGGPVGG